MKSPDPRPQITRTAFRRFECKYLITEKLARKIVRHIRPFVEPDPFAAQSPDFSYDISSLYLDSPDLRLFWETQNGLLDRIKLRIRTYSDSGQDPVFMEIKRRFNSQVLKDRTKLDRDHVSSVLAGATASFNPASSSQKACYDEFVSLVARWFALPKVWVKYRREAYVGVYNRDVRITMDRNLVCGNPAQGLDLTPPSLWVPVEPRMVVLEIKFDESFPHWVAQLTQRFLLQKQSYSKYGNSVKRGLLETPSLVREFKAVN